MGSYRITGDPTRDAWEAHRQKTEHEYEDALMAANEAKVGTREFHDAMADVRALREELRAINGDRRR